jgi:hypothetical protein
MVLFSLVPLLKSGHFERNLCRSLDQQQSQMFLSELTPRIVVELNVEER